MTTIRHQQIRCPQSPPSHYLETDTSNQNSANSKADYQNPLQLSTNREWDSTVFHLKISLKVDKIKSISGDHTLFNFSTTNINVFHRNLRYLPEETSIQDTVKYLLLLILMRKIRRIWLPHFYIPPEKDPCTGILKLVIYTMTTTEYSL